MNLYETLLITLAIVKPEEPTKPSAFDPSFFIVIIIFVLAFIFLIDRPQKRRQAELAKKVEGLKKGDKVVSAGGIHGVIAKVNKEKNTVLVTVAKGFDIEFNRGSVSPLKEESPIKDTAKDKEKDKEEEKKG